MPETPTTIISYALNYDTERVSRDPKKSKILLLDEDVQLVPPEVWLIEHGVSRCHGIGGLNVGVVVDTPVWLADLASRME
jgi:hypothetical protein